MNQLSCSLTSNNPLNPSSVPKTREAEKMKKEVGKRLDKRGRSVVVDLYFWIYLLFHFYQNL